MSEKLNNKTCGECLYYDEPMCDYNAMKVPNTRIACKLFDPKEKPPTNGDKIIAGGMRAIASLVCCHRCDVCIYANYKAENTGLDQGGFTCECPSDKTCLDGIEAYLNAPAESEVEDEQ